MICLHQSVSIWQVLDTMGTSEVATHFWMLVVFYVRVAWCMLSWGCPTCMFIWLCGCHPRWEWYMITWVVQNTIGYEHLILSLTWYATTTHGQQPLRPYWLWLRSLSNHHSLHLLFMVTTFATTIFIAWSTFLERFYFHDVAFPSSSSPCTCWFHFSVFILPTVNAFPTYTFYLDIYV